MGPLRKFSSSIFFLVLLLTLTACDDKKDTATQTDSIQSSTWNQQISHHTSGIIRKNSELRIRFVNDMIPEQRIGESASAILEISPGIKAEITFNGRREILIKPAEYLQPGQRYQVKVLAGQLEEIPNELGEFKFFFDVIPRDFEVRTLGLSSTANTVQLNGVVETSDIEDNALIEKLVSFDMPGQEVTVSWNHSASGTNHEFTIRDIKRQDQTVMLDVTWDGGVLDVDTKGSHQLEVPALGEFKVSNAKTVEGQRKYIQVKFSETLDPKQNLKGLVQLGNQKFTTRIVGDILNVYPENVKTGKYILSLEQGVKSQLGTALKKRFEEELFFEMQEPKVRFSGTGVILPANKVLSIPFQTMNVKTVQVKAFRVYENNMGQFLQANKLEGQSGLNRVGRFLWQKTIDLGKIKENSWNRFSLDATELLKGQQGALFRLTISVNRKDSIYACPAEDENSPVVAVDRLKNYDDLHVTESSGWDYAENYYSNNGTWADRRNPCKDAFFKYSNETKSSRNFIASNLALIAKRGAEGTLRVVSTHLKTAKPIQGVKIEVLNFQNQSIGKGTTDAIGFAQIKSDGTPFYLIARHNNEIGYLKVNAATALPMSHFDVGGDKVKQGVKGHIYGERGVWRPGDDVYLTFVLEDKNNIIPDKHPVTMQLYNPKGQLMQSKTNNDPVGDFYTFNLKTADNDLTGNWIAKAILGGSTFTKTLKIETVIPNRLKVETTFEGEVLRQSQMPVKGHLFGQWLHGADAKKLKADVSVRLTPRATKFTRNSDFAFDDPVRKFKGEPQTIFEDRLDKTGNQDFEANISVNSEAPGMLTAHFTSRVFEEGGAFSSSRSSMPYHAYENYVGIKLPKGGATREMLLTDKKHLVEIASLNAEGEPVSLNKVEVSIYKISWRWWWDQSGDNLAAYASNFQRGLQSRNTISTTNGSGKWEFDIKYPDWGRYLVRACDMEGKHCSGKIVYIDWPGWAGRAKESGGPGANALTLQSDKREYNVGESATINLPPATQGRALISIETGSKILDQRWFEFSDKKTQFPLKLTKAMSPNVYVSVTLIQPHQDKDNDRPIRLYGVVPIKVNDPSTRLKPELKTADEWAPASTVEVAVSEDKGLAMTYTLAVVDEGLLGLTSFKTPNLHKQFYKKEALGVLTWDLFDQVAGAYGGELERLLALGGDAKAEDPKNSEEQKRFPPVVRFMGPFKLKASESKKHSIDIPQYIGAVRVMVIAGDKGAYGSADKSVFVRGKLSLLATVPRVIGPEEELTVPVALFTMKEDIKEVELAAESSEHFEIIGDAKQTITFEKQGEKLGLLKFKVKPKLGKGRLKFIATSGEYSAEAEIFIDVRSANPPTLRQTTGTLEGKDSWENNIVPHGLPGTNKITMEVSAIPPINLERRLNYLIRYPHGCVEQVTSSVFPQLYLPTLVRLGPERKKEVQSNIDAGIARLGNFQTGEGSFMYWPGAWGNNVNEWATSYVGHFLVEAKKQGYHVPADMLNNWIDYQTNTSRSWLTGTGEGQTNQAYRLYTLALANKPELSSMNRLRETGNLSSVEKWQLAAAYRLAGLTSAAEDLVKGDKLSLASYRISGITFGSTLRDQAILLNGMVAVGENKKAKKLVEDISAELYADKWHSTQSVAYALMALSKYVGLDQPEGFAKFSYGLGANSLKEVDMDAPLYQLELPEFPSAGQLIKMENKSKRDLYISIFSEGMPRAGQEEASSNGLRIKVSYTDIKGRSVDISDMKQGQDFIANVIVRNLKSHKLENIALTHVVPSGWEIHNPRFAGEQAKPQAVDYQDIRDDRVLTYFSMKENEEKKFSVLLNATYLGNYYLPSISVEAMYDASNQARTKGQWVKVVRGDL